MIKKYRKPSNLLAFVVEELNVDLAELRSYPTCGEVARCRRVIAHALLADNMSVADVADLLYVTEAVIRRWRSKGKREEIETADILRSKYYAKNR